MNVLSTYGRVASDVTTNNVNGRNVANFRFASNNKRKGSDGKYGTNFYNVSAWGTLADTASKFLKKGQRAAISGDLTIRTYKGNDGLDHQVVEIDANNIDLVETKAEAEAKESTTAAPAAQATPQVEPSGFTAVENDELPFD